MINTTRASSIEPIVDIQISNGENQNSKSNNALAQLKKAAKLRKRQEESEQAKAHLQARIAVPDNICGVDSQKVTEDFRNYRQLSYGQRYVLHANLQEWILLKQIQNFPQRKDMRRVSLGNLKCYKDVKQSPIILQKLQRINHFLYHNANVYPVFANSVKKQDTQEREIEIQMRNQAAKMELLNSDSEESLRRNQNHNRTQSFIRNSPTTMHEQSLELALDGSVLPGYMQGTKRLKQFRRSRFFNENHPNNEPIKKTLSSFDNFVTQVDTKKASHSRQTKYLQRKLGKQLSQADEEVNKSFQVNLSFENYANNYNVNESTFCSSTKSQMFKNQLSSLSKHMEIKNEEKKEKKLRRRIVLDPLEIPVALDQKEIREKSLANNLNNIQFDDLEMEDLCDEPEFLGSYFNASKQLVKKK